MSSLGGIGTGASTFGGAFEPAELLRPQVYSHPVTRLESRETPISLIILTGPFAYKIKKRVHLSYIDTTTLPRRRHYCTEELRLNRRLAADLYVDVVAIRRDGGTLHVGGPGAGSKGRVIDYAVQMRQFDADQELSSLLEHDAVIPAEIAGLASEVADFHAAAAVASKLEDFGHTEQLRDAVLGTLATLLSQLDAADGAADLGRLVDWTHDFLREQLPRLHAREEQGFIRECHGDLHARNVVRWRGRLTPFDCLEFDPKLRWIDMMSDVAFMVMDLAAHGRWDLALCFLNAYLERTGDYGGVRLLPFYAVYRALVRAMVDSIGRDPRGAQARLATAAQFMHRPRPALIMMHGPSGSGKSWLSERLCGDLRAVRIRSDVERKRIAAGGAVGAADRGYERGLYDPAMSRHTYARLLQSAEDCLGGGFNTIVDAAFLRRADRRAFADLAERHGFPGIILSCESDRAVMAERIGLRRRSAADPSDADLAVLDRQLRSMEALDPAETLHAVSVDTSDPGAPARVLEDVRRRLGAA